MKTVLVLFGPLLFAQLLPAAPLTPARVTKILLQAASLPVDSGPGAINGTVVTVLGTSPASVFTNTPNYTGSGGNGTTTGTFGGNGATTQPLNLAPGF